MGIASYPWLFYGANNDTHYLGENGVRIGDDGGLFIPWFRYLGFSLQFYQDFKIVIHVLVLYLGSLTCSWVKIYHYARILDWKEANIHTNKSDAMAMQQEMTLVPNPKCLYRSFQNSWIQPTIQSLQLFHQDNTYRWTKLRNYFIAPLAEEVIFRACLLPPLLACSNPSGKPTLSPTQASWIAPHFFGIAHLHHFYEQWRHLHPSRKTPSIFMRLSIGVACQWGYTTLFGAYVSHVFIRTASLNGVVFAHIVCNYMGLPDFGFIHPSSGSLYGYRLVLGVMYLLGVGMFVLGFGFGDIGERLQSLVFPKESVLPSLLYAGTQVVDK